MITKEQQEILDDDFENMNLVIKDIKHKLRIYSFIEQVNIYKYMKTVMWNTWNLLCEERDKKVDQGNELLKQIKFKNEE